MYLELEEKLKALAEEFFRQNNVYIFEFKIFRQGKDLILRFFVDKPEGGISIDECSLLNRQLGELLDKEDVLDENFVLEISSPGVDRNLKTKEDFLRIIGKEIVCFLRAPYEAKTEIRGKLMKATDESITICNSREYELNLTNIAKARQVIEVI